MERFTFTNACLLGLVTLAGTSAASAQTVWEGRRRRVEDPCTVVPPPPAPCDRGHALRGAEAAPPNPPVLVVVGGERGPCADPRCGGTCGAVHVAQPWERDCAPQPTLTVGPVTVWENTRRGTWERRPATCEPAPVSPWSPRRVLRGPRPVTPTTTCNPEPTCDPEPCGPTTCEPANPWSSRRSSSCDPAPTGRVAACDPAPTGRTRRPRQDDPRWAAATEVDRLAAAVLDALKVGDYAYAERLAASACDPSELARALHGLLPSAALLEQARCAVGSRAGRFPTLAWLLGCDRRRSRP